jgi:hypothetical protein
MATKGERNVYKVYNYCDVSNSDISIYIYWFNSHNETSEDGHEILEITKE